MKRSDYNKKAPIFRARLVAEGKKPRDEQVWPEFEDWLQTPGISTCTTPSCVVFGQPFPVTLNENADGVHRGVCGRCGQSTVPVPVLEED